ncbi:YdiU family protein [Vibrio metschnikovii]|uniref:Protein adenylyltransferase SelO family protein n=1 Tax=bacterium 19MO03SA05 TaxID=2920620 RepID=A0AAU6VB64_UNCXX|nr:MULTISPECIES: protein adenylyltransferase SelO family protein [unclassified Vibrio]EKO3570930.1 YdiU family protein [Vibrio metschnikovii]EKO3579200.1 YdiU family protein [Vibrio metschnikovii]EKO3582073.1 YdiU family protein [Vibrio metschnikovii]EKO3671990.1 YdiU family protein [Vibrio metschnikovii]EKO3913889.1 YdiU family protein [Vibrio metschnikovii]
MDAELLQTYKCAGKDNTPIVDNYLPKESFVLFDAYKLKGTEVVWINKELIQEYEIELDEESIKSELIENFSYVSKGYTKKTRIITNDKKQFMADQYGSRHEICNGGSARCGINGHFQIKGIGRNPLVAANMSESHSHGKLFIDEAISEAIWGEICHKHLPYGAIRTLAIIKTNVKHKFGYLDGAPDKHCALAIRETSVRPAHFERCTFFWPEESYRYLRDNDANRVRKAMPYLSNLLLGKNQNTSLGDTLNIVIDRLACQIAASRVKGIPHGSLTSSNISVDGRFLDFGTITAVPDFGNYVLANGVGAVWDDHELIEAWLVNFIDTVNHYSEGDFTPSKIREYSSNFSKLLDEYENRFLLIELGIEDHSESNLQQASLLKERLKSEERRFLTRFNDHEFRQRVLIEAEACGFDISTVEFPLRKAKYSSFTMLQGHLNTKYDYQSVSQLINSYLS